MSIIYKVNGVTLTNRVRLLDEGGVFPTAANRGEVGMGGVMIDDPGSTLTIQGWQTFTVEDDEAFPDNRIFTGYIAERPTGRNGRMRVGTDRAHSCTIIDLNALLHVHVFHNNASKRGAESDVARVAYMLTSEALSGLVFDAGLVSTGSPVNFLEADLRRTFADEAIGSMAPIAAKNFFVYRDTTTGSPSLFYDAYQSTVNSSGLRISNVSTDVDNVTTFAPSLDATDEIQPSEVYSGVSYGWRGAPLYVTSATTETAFFSGINGRDAVYDTDRVGHLATAQSEAINYLNVHSTETHFLRCSVILPSGKATQIKAGQRIEVKFSHLDGFTSFTWVRIIRCGAIPVAPQFWQLDLELWVPQVPVSDATDSGACDTNYALGLTVVNSQTGPGAPMGLSGGGTLAALTDGLHNPATSPQTSYGGHVTGSSGDYTFSFAVDLGAAQSIASMNIWWFNGIGFDSITAEYSAVGTAGPWTDAGASGTLASPTTTLTFAAHSARYWQFSITHFYTALTYWPALISGADSLLEWEVLGCVSTTGTPFLGDIISGEVPATAPDGTTTVFATGAGYLDGTLEVFVDGQNVASDLTETDSSAGTFTLGFAPYSDEVITTEYVAR